MRIRKTELEGVRLVELEAVSDQRGFFGRTFCEREFKEHGLTTRFVQHSISYTAARGSIRGLHYQGAPAEEAKIVSCIRGAIYDVVVDLRPNSPTHRRWQSFELSAENRRRLFIPIGFAHGFQTLTCDAEVAYLISAFYCREAAAGVRYNDPTFAIDWPLPLSSISDKDKAWPDYDGNGI